MTTTNQPTTEQVVERIARDILDVETLEQRNSDRLDFHELAVWKIREALEAAYNAGVAQGARAAGRSKRNQPKANGK